MNLDDVRVFALRDWKTVEKSKRAYWAEQRERLGLAEMFAVAEGLRAFVRSVRPGWPTERDRDADLERHIELKRLLDQASDALAGR